MSATADPSASICSTCRSRELNRSSGSVAAVLLSTLVDHRIGQLPAEIAITLVHRADRVHHLLRRRALDDVAGRTGLQGAQHVHRVGIHGKHDHAGLRTVLVDDVGRLGAIQSRHGMIHEHDVRVHFLRSVHRLPAVLDAVDDLHIVLRLDHEAQAFRHDAVIVDDEYTDRHVS